MSNCTYYEADGLTTTTDITQAASCQGGKVYRAVAGTHTAKGIQLSGVPPFVNGTHIAWGTHNFTDGIFIDGDQTARRSDLWSGTDAVTMLVAAGNHDVALDTTQDQGIKMIAVNMLAGHRICLADHDSCLSLSPSGHLVYQVGTSQQIIAQ